VKCNGSRHTGPIHEYSHATNCEFITGGAFVPNDRSWPDEYDDSYLFADFVCNRIFELRPDGAGFDHTVFDHEGGVGAHRDGVRPIDDEGPLLHDLRRRTGAPHRA
jgi:hypothetical protein